MARSTQFLLISAVIFLFAFAQRTEAQRIGLGASFGFNQASHLNNFQLADGAIDLSLNPELRNGYQFGIIYREIISNNFRLQVEPQFVVLGANYSGTFTFQGNELQTVSETELHYIHVPLLVQLTTTPPDRARYPRPWPEFTFHLTAGGYGAYLLDAAFFGSVAGTPIGVEFSDTFNNNVKSQYSDYEAGLIVGAGSEFGLNHKLGLDFRLIYGLMNSVDTTQRDFQMNNVSFNVSLYYIF